MQNFKNLKVWEKSHRLVLKIYDLTKNFPTSEKYGVTSQLKRAAVSIATNIAEGSGRGGNIDFARFLEIAAASASECEYLALLCRDLGLLTTTHHQELTLEIEEIRKMLHGLIQKLKM